VLKAVKTDTTEATSRYTLLKTLSKVCGT